MRPEMTRLYDVFVDWHGRLGREMPGIRKRLDAAQARRVLDVGCGTGRHVRALLDAGYDAHGADASPEMLAKARAFARDDSRFHDWRLGDAPPPGLLALAPFDAVVCLGNVWPQIVEDAEVAAAARGCHSLLRPQGLLLAGLKAVAIRRGGNPFLPLLRREHQGRTLWFVRFVDFEGHPEGTCGFHMVVVRDGDEALLHDEHRIRAWSPETLAGCFSGAGFAEVSVSGRIDDPGVAPTTEDVFVHARR